MLNISFTSQFKKDYKAAEKRGFDLTLLKFIITELAEGRTLPLKYKDHLLTGEYAGFRECHVKSDWLLIYYIESDMLILTRTGTHSDLF